MKGIGYFQNLRIFFRNCLEFFGNFLGGFFWRNFFGRTFWEEFFGRNYLVEINKELMFLSRFCLNAQGRKEGRKDKNLDP